METQVELENMQTTNRKYAQRIMTLETHRIKQYDKIVELEQALNCTTLSDVHFLLGILIEKLFKTSKQDNRSKVDTLISPLTCTKSR